MKKHLFAFLPAVALLFAAIILSYTIFINSLVNKNIVVEAGSPLPPAGGFIKSNQFGCEYAGDVSGIDMSAPGTYNLQISVNKRTFHVTMTVKDTKAPVAKPANQQIMLGETLEASVFVTDASDISDITLSYKSPPDFDKPGQQDVTVILSDVSGNTSEVTASLDIITDEEAPVITGVVDQSVFIGEPVSYKTGVTVTDNLDTDVKLEIDNSAVNLGKEGTYSVIYSATDKSGNKSEVPATITVKVKPAGYVSEQELNVLVDEVFTEILKPGMTDLERISEIFYWIAGHIDYTNTSDKSDWIKAAYQGITRGTGDCFNYFATARAMLTRAGYECISVERALESNPMTSHHYWNLVRYNGEYYHFDPLPQLKYYHYVCLLRTDAEVAEYSTSGQKGFYKYDHDGIPATAAEPLVIERKLIYG
jgi:hypothetical protein